MFLLIIMFLCISMLQKYKKNQSIIIYIYLNYKKVRYEHKSTRLIAQSSYNNFLLTIIFLCIGHEFVYQTKDPPWSLITIDSQLLVLLSYIKSSSV